jgi:hypothetical protein
MPHDLRGDGIGRLPAVDPNQLGPARQLLLERTGVTVMNLQAPGDRLVGVVGAGLLSPALPEASGQLFPRHFEHRDERS